MKCDRKKPESCFNCPYPECIEDDTDIMTDDEFALVYKPTKTYVTDRSMREYQRNYREEHREELREKSRIYREKHREQMNASRRRSYYKNRDYYIEWQKRYDDRKREEKYDLQAR
jgi:hypothetical protein